jgi:hypothetical protein
MSFVFFIDHLFLKVLIRLCRVSLKKESDSDSGSGSEEKSEKVKLIPLSLYYH